jgi:hypothetical protein
LPGIHRVLRESDRLLVALVSNTLKLQFGAKEHCAAMIAVGADSSASSQFHMPAPQTLRHAAHVITTPMSYIDSELQGRLEHIQALLL